MPELTPLELLQHKLAELERTLEKSAADFRLGILSEDQHYMHRLNLQPKIHEYNLAIKIIKEYGTHQKMK